MFFQIILFIIGLLLLVKSADFLVRGASALALRLRINPMVIGLTVVAFGTSTPELVVSITSAISGNTGVAFGNVVGSNIANILLILGISAIVTPLAVQKNTVWKEVPMSFLGAVVLAILGIQNILDRVSTQPLSITSTQVIGSLTFSNGLILLLFFIIFLYYTFGIAKVTGDDEPLVKKETMPKSIFVVVVGLMGLIIGSKFLVDSAVYIATAIGVSQTFIGLTIVAVGTSLPELVTSVVAAIRKQAEIAVGNVVGSNIFNIFLVLGVTSTTKEIPINGQSLGDILVLFIATFVLFISFFIMKKRVVGRLEGITMVTLYIGYLSFLVMRG